MQFTLTDKRKFAKLLNIDEKALDTEWLKYESRLKDIIRQSLETNTPVENLFEPVWNEITGELRGLYAL